MYRNGHPDAGVRARQLLEHQDVREKVCASSPVLLRHANTHQAQLRKPTVQLAGKMVLPIPFGCVRIDLGSRELTRQCLNLALVLR